MLKDLAKFGDWGVAQVVEDAGFAGEEFLGLAEGAGVGEIGGKFLEDTAFLVATAVFGQVGATKSALAQLEEDAVATIDRVPQGKGARLIGGGGGLEREKTVQAIAPSRGEMLGKVLEGAEEVPHGWLAGGRWGVNAVL